MKLFLTLIFSLLFIRPTSADERVSCSKVAMELEGYFNVSYKKNPKKPFKDYGDAVLTHFDDKTILSVDRNPYCRPYPTYFFIVRPYTLNGKSLCGLFTSTSTGKMNKEPWSYFIKFESSESAVKAIHLQSHFSKTIYRYEKVPEDRIDNSWPTY